MLNDSWIVEKFNGGASVEWLAHQAYLTAKSKNEKITHKQARAIVEQAIYEDIMQKKGYGA